MGTNIEYKKPETAKEHKKVFVDGPVSTQFIADSIAKHSSKKNIGAHHLFLGQVRNDTVDSRITTAIEYTAHKELAEEVLYNLREEIFRKYGIICMHIFHSLGRVNAGEICLFVFVSSKHRKEAGNACSEIVEEIKKNLPVWGKVIYEDESYSWKENTK